MKIFQLKNNIYEDHVAASCNYTFVYRSGNQDAVYTAQYRQKIEGGTDSPWLEEEVEKTMAPPTITLNDLTPDTTYEVLT